MRELADTFWTWLCSSRIMHACTSDVYKQNENGQDAARLKCFLGLHVKEEVAADDADMSIDEVAANVRPADSHAREHADGKILRMCMPCEYI